QQIACPVCDGQAVSESNAPEARAIRDDIPERIAAGESDAEIRAAYVARYGDGVLLAPAGAGLGLLAWALPLVVLALGALGVGLTVRRWSRAPRLVPAPEDVTAVEAARRDRGDGGE
ncbi:MAG: cytochrome c-type biogenesis protein CcmH, partial [Actinomycetota bacterium]